MKKIITMLMIFTVLILVGCSTHVHTIGTGPQTGIQKSARQYYILYGLIPVNTVNTGKMVGDATNYEIQSQVGAMDALINTASAVAIAGLVSSRTVTVTK